MNTADKDALHAAIMNLRCEVPSEKGGPFWLAGYRIGHRDARHAAAELVSASLVAPQESVEGFLCRAWGETDLPEARLVRSQDEWEAFVVEAQWGPGVSYASLDAEDREQVDAQIRYIKDDMADNSAGEMNFEIGGISVEHVTFLSIKEQAVKPATDKEMPK